jgi:type 1 glutamine amidotransferase
MASDFGLVHFAPGAKPDDVKSTAKYLVVWKRQRGKWKVFYDCWNWNASEKDRQ